VSIFNVKVNTGKKLEFYNVLSMDLETFL